MGAPSSQISGEAGVIARVRAYNATGEMDISSNIMPEPRDDFTLGARVLLICEVTGIPKESEVVNYTWYHNCTSSNQGGCEVRDGDPYYRVVSDILLVDVTSWDQGGRYFCFAKFHNHLPQTSYPTSIINVAS